MHYHPQYALIPNTVNPSCDSNSGWNRRTIKKSNEGTLYQGSCMAEGSIQNAARVISFPISPQAINICLRSYQKPICYQKLTSGPIEGSYSDDYRNVKPLALKWVPEQGAFKA